MNLVPKNWREFQHYKDRSPPWIRLQRKLLDDRDFHSLPVASRALAPMLWLLASESISGEFNGDPAELAFRLRSTTKEMSGALRPLLEAGFFIPVQSASTPLAKSPQDACPEALQRQSITEAEDSAEPQADSTPPFILLPLVDGSEHPVAEPVVVEWEAAYPAVNVRQQLREMRQWCLANRANRKTTRGIDAFVNRWLGKEQDKGATSVSRPLGGKASPTETTPANPAAIFVPPKPLTPEERAKSDAARVLAMSAIKTSRREAA